MNDLKKKTFYTIFSIISLFIVFSTFIYNYQIYMQEYHNIENNLTRMKDFLNFDKNEEDNLNKRYIMDYYVYTILLDQNNRVIARISHNENKFNDKILKKANEILNEKKESKLKIGILYFTSIAYNFNSGKYLIMIDTSIIRNSLLMILLKSLIIIFISEIAVLLISKKITEWITKPVEESFNKQKDFIANASHELKTPLAVIIASTDCISENKKNKKWLDNIKNESEKMNNLITRLLDLSKSETIKQDGMKMNNLSKIIEKRAVIFESLAYEKKVKIETNIKNNVMFKCSSHDLDEVISILIDNAIKHSEENTTINVNLYEDKNNITIEVINKGNEITKEESTKIFERFYRADKSRNREENRYGLGLSIAKNIVENYNGKIKASSNDGYTTFTINFKHNK